jgi:hypothetical protein
LIAILCLLLGYGLGWWRYSEAESKRRRHLRKPRQNTGPNPPAAAGIQPLGHYGDRRLHRNLRPRREAGTPPIPGDAPAADTLDYESRQLRRRPANLLALTVISRRLTRL